MNTVTRTFGKLTHRSPGDNARVSVLLSDYEDIDGLLVKVSNRNISTLDLNFSAYSLFVIVDW